MSVADDLFRAADIMEERGQCRGVPVNDDGRVCALGAIALATGVSFEGSYLFNMDKSPRASAAVRALAESLGWKKTGAQWTVWSYNDRLFWNPEKRMVKTFRKAAAQCL